MAYDLFDIRNKVRKLTGRISPTQITDLTIDDYINDYYFNDLPEYLRLLRLKDVYTFITQPNIDTYAFSGNLNTTVEPPATCAGNRIDFFNNNETFYTRWQKKNFIQQIATGNGGPGPYVGTITNRPFLRSVNAGTFISEVDNVLITGTTNANVALTAKDNGFGGFIAPAVGNINYLTGAVTVTFGGNIAIGAPIWAETVPYVASIPLSLMFWQNQFVLRPVPDKAYIVELNTTRKPTSLINDLDSPEFDEWWKLLAFGAALQILIDNADFEIIANLRPYFEEQLLLCQRRVIMQGRSQRASTLFSENNQYPFGNNYPYI